MKISKGLKLTRGAINSGIQLLTNGKRIKSLYTLLQALQDPQKRDSIKSLSVDYLTPQERASLITVLGTGVHNIFAGGKKNLGRAALEYLQRTNQQVEISTRGTSGYHQIDLSNKYFSNERRQDFWGRLENAIENMAGVKDYEGMAQNLALAEINTLRKKGKGIIIGNHNEGSGNLSDYMGLLSLLGHSDAEQDILKNTIFYTADFNHEMNSLQFPGYTFRSVPTNPQDINAMRTFLALMKQDCEKTNKEGGYIFIIPMGEGSVFKSAFSHIQKYFEKVADSIINAEDNSIINEKPKVLSTYTDGGLSYHEQLQRLKNGENKPRKVRIKFHLGTLQEYPKNKEEATKYYRSLFNVQPNN